MRPMNINQATALVKRLAVEHGSDIDIDGLSGTTIGRMVFTPESPYLRPLRQWQTSQDLGRIRLKPESGKIFGLPWWLVVGGGIVVLAGAGTGGVVAAQAIGKSLNFKKGKETYGALVDISARATGIPSDVILLFIQLESGFNPNTYNPEVSALGSWPCAVANDSKWKANPDYQNAVSVCEMMKRDPNVKQGGKLVLSSTAVRLRDGSKTSVPYEQKLWKFGSFGLGCMSAMAARSAGFPYNRSNKDLFKPEVNIPLIAKTIKNLRDKFYPGRTSLNTSEWARVRAGYVGGPGIWQKGPTAATEIAGKFSKAASGILT